MQVKVLDLSHHNLGPNRGAIDFAAIADFGVRGVILKGTQGATYGDPVCHDRLAAAASAGLLTGAYDFNTGDPIKQQVDFFFDFVKPTDQMVCALDFEDNAASNMSLDQAREYLELADARLGRNFWFYSGNRFKHLSCDADDETLAFFGKHKLWLCQYGPRMKMVNDNGDPLPWDKATLWQFSGDGVNAQGIRVPGIYFPDAGKIDMNAYAGSDEDLAAEWIA